MDRQITIARNPKPFTAGGWLNYATTWREFASKLSDPMTGSELFEEYLKAGKKEKSDYKCSAGGYVGGPVDDSGLRRKYHISGRDIVTLDFDHLVAGDDKVIHSMCEMMGCDYVIHSSQSHTASAPRLRVLIPLSRTVHSSNEYAAVSRKLASKIDPTMSKLDKTTHEYERLMFYPRHSKDAPYLFLWGGMNRSDMKLCDVDAILGEYTNWEDTKEWPKAPENDFPEPMPDERRMKRNPEERAEPIGSFCQFFSIHDVIEMFLSDVYSPVNDENGGNRYTYTKGTSIGGAIVYDDKFLFSHHDTDPAVGRTLNAFELVQIHKFGYLDEEENRNDDSDFWNEKKSFAAMCRWVQDEQDENLNRYRVEVVRNKGKRFSEMMDALIPKDIVSDFGDLVSYGPEIPAERLERNKDGSIVAKLQNVLTVISEDPMLKGRIKYDVIHDGFVVYGNLPWQVGDLGTDSRLRKSKCADENGWKLWDANADLTGLRMYLENKYGLPHTKKSLVEDALNYHARANLRNGVVEYLNSLAWDGTPRLDTLFIDYLGAEDNAPTREATRKALLGCVYRAFEPGCKFDEMCTLIGPQGIGKSTILAKLAHESWFTDSIYSFEGPKVAENIKGCWIAEIGELHALKKAEVGQVRQILASRVDKNRFAYEKDKSNNPRHCVFFGTGNDPEVVRDPAGERRFWLIEVGVNKAAKSVWEDLTDYEIDQIWAEAVIYYKVGEDPVISNETRDALLERQKDFRDEDPWEGIIAQFICSKVPKDWAKWPVAKRNEFHDRFKADILNKEETADYSCMTGINGEIVGELVERDRICALELWCECLSGQNSYSKDAAGVRLTKVEKKRINTAIRSLLTIDGDRTIKSNEGTSVLGKWKYMAVDYRDYGIVKGFKRVY